LSLSGNPAYAPSLMSRLLTSYIPRIRLLWLLAADLVILCLAFLGSVRLRLGTWDLFAYKDGLEPVLIISVAIYTVGLVASGLYRMTPSTMHLEGFLRVSVGLIAAWAASVAALFLLDPGYMPPRSITAVQLMLSLIGVLGFRAAIRFADELANPASVNRDARSTPDIPSFSIHDVIERESVYIDRPALRDYLAGRTVLVTGAGGSIGSALSELLLELRPFRLLLVDNSEYNLYQLEKKLRKHPYASELEFRIADVREEDIMRSLFTNYAIDVIFHAAAYKHVPLMERHPIEAFRNNTMATVGLLRLCESFDVEQFIFISTDKAVAPSSVLGATKRLAEWYVRAANQPTHRKIVRFGNVFDSQGSVVPLFREQIESGGPVMLTHPDMERFFISADEACALVLQTLLLNSDASTYMLRMEPAVKIRLLAERMIEKLSPDPHRLPAIEYSGVRPGEKIDEELMNDDEQPIPTQHPRILGLLVRTPFARAVLDAHLAYLQSLAANSQAEILRRALFQTEIGEPSVKSRPTA
jgi:FlaA1/EpsC-like NDP-sugar epimerase